MGIRVLMIVIPIILAFASFGIYKKYYTLKGEKMEEITRKVNENACEKADSLRVNNSIIKGVVYETDYFSRGNENFPFIQ